jgi:hypothetical protein
MSADQLAAGLMPRAGLHLDYRDAEMGEPFAEC